MATHMAQNISLVPTRCPFNDRNFHVMPFVNNPEINMPVTTGISTVNTVVTGIHKTNNGPSTLRPIVTDLEKPLENKAVIQSEIPSMDSAVDGGTLESIDLSAITPGGALVLHPSQEIFNDFYLTSYAGILPKWPLYGQNDR